MSSHPPVDSTPPFSLYIVNCTDDCTGSSANAKDGSAARVVDGTNLVFEHTCQGGRPGHVGYGNGTDVAIAPSILNNVSPAAIASPAFFSARFQIVCMADPT